MHYLNLISVQLIKHNSNLSLFRYVKRIFIFISKICMVKILYPEYILITANYCFKSLHCLIKIVNVKDQISECSSSDLYLSLARTVGRIHIIFLASCIFEQRTLADYKPWRYGTLSMTRALYVLLLLSAAWVRNLHCAHLKKFYRKKTMLIQTTFLATFIIWITWNISIS